jgi:hypothetical protein
MGFEITSILKMVLKNRLVFKKEEDKIKYGWRNFVS